LTAGPWKIAVIFGGASMERDVSVASAAQVIAALRSRGHEVTAIDAARGLLSQRDEAAVLRADVERAPPRQLAGSDERVLAALLGEGAFDRFDLAFLALHGGAGENGTVQALLSSGGVSFTGTGHLSSAVAMDKDLSKRLFRSAGIPTADWLMTTADVPDDIASLGMPLIVKPNAQGSTVGLTLVSEPDGIADAITVAREFDKEIMLERYVPGRELTVGVLDGAALSVGEIIPAHGGLFDYESKYQSGGAEEVFPANVSEDIAARAQKLACAVSETLKIECYCRVDFRLDPDERLWCLEVNTLPGLTSGSLLPRSAAASGIEFAALCERICALALARSSVRG
jgi:D-alanine-D-alanine ligase